MESIVKDLREIVNRIEDLDDPTASSAYRNLIGDAHYSIEECITALEMITTNRPESGR